MLYAIEDPVRSTSAEQRRAVRAEQARVIVDDLHTNLEARLRQLSQHSSFPCLPRPFASAWASLG
ncbi:IS66 family transposase [Novosphingobium soli]|uniref:Transposase n=1 Tax=Novosphingobium soli TaxID=574956 RepID=A0ABV6CY70_9SPHN